MNVLTIDIDYAFSPSISIYDDYVIGSRISFESQKSILNEEKLPEPKLNIEKFNDIKKVLNYARPNAPVISIEHHHEILDYIPKKIKVSLQNIDHHHDIFYPDWHDLDQLDEGNWVYHLSKTNQLEKYTWFKNNDSEPFCNCIDLNFDFSQYLEIKEKYILMPDIIILCSSPHWTYDVDNLLIEELLR